MAEIQRKVDISVSAHHSSIIVIAAHHDCAGNPVSDDIHKSQTLNAIEIIESWNLNVTRIIGLWVNNQWQVEVIYDNGAQGYVPIHYATAISCIDGRARDPLSDWMKQKYLVHYVDLITEPEADAYIVRAAPEQLAILRQKIGYSMNEHHSEIVVISAHHDCAKGAMSDSDRRRQLKQASQIIAAFELPVQVVGVWLNEQWQCEIIYDSSAIATKPLRAVI